MRKVVISGMIGNALEWYDFILYAQFAHIISKTFFPPSHASDILTFAIFAAGFFVRPLGGLVFGNIGDKLGRRLALSIGILTMALPTACIGLLPSYDKIGVTSSILLAVIRLIQGFSLGGEFSGCISYIVEHSPIEKRGLAGSASFVSMCLGMLMGALTASFMTYVLSPEDLSIWGWRIPFIAGLFIGLVGLYIRLNLSESPIYQAAKARGKLSSVPFRDLIKENLPELLISIIIYMIVTGPFYTINVYVENLLLKTFKYSPYDSSLVGTIGVTVLIISMPIAAYISDKIGRKKVLVAGAISLCISIYPIFLLFGTQNLTNAIIAQVLFGIFLGTYMGPMPTTLVEIFPTKVRFSGVGLSYNLSAAIFGGTAPMVGTFLVQKTQNEYAMSFYLLGILIFATFVLIKYFKETYQKDLSY